MYTGRTAREGIERTQNMYLLTEWEGRTGTIFMARTLSRYQGRHATLRVEALGDDHNNGCDGDNK